MLLNRITQLPILKLCGFGLIVLLLFFLRVVSFNTNVLNHDELEWLYGIERTWIDPRPFIGFEAHTSGPLSIYLLSILKLFVDSPSTMHLRLFGFFAFILPTIALLFFSKKNYFNFAGIVLLFSLLAIKKEDIFGYNTEYQIMLFTAILYVLLTSALNWWRLISFAAILILFFFIKIQVLFLLAFFGLAMAIKLLYTKNYHYLFGYLLATVLLFACIVFYLGYTHTLHEAYYVYIEKNLFYTSTISGNTSEQWVDSVLPFLKKKYHFFLYPILGVLGSFLLLWFRERNAIRFSKSLLMKILESRFFLSLMLYLTSLLTILYSKNDFLHYYIIAFFPLAALFSELFYLISSRVIPSKIRITYWAFLLICFAMNFSYGNLAICYGYVTSSENDRQQYKLGFPKGYLVNPDLSKWLLDHRDRKNTKLLSLGWFKSQMLCYVLGLPYSPVFRSANFFWYITSYQQGQKYFFERDEANLMQDLKNQPPYYIVDFDNILQQVPDTRFAKYVQSNYHLVKSSYNYAIFARRN